MISRINVVVDASGSIAENGKDSVVKYLLNLLPGMIEMNGYGSYETEFLQWSARIFPLESSAKLHFDGETCQESFVQYLEQTGDDTATLLISDGDFLLNREQQKSIRNLKRRIFCIAVGADAELGVLKKISSYPVIFRPYDIANVFALVDRLNSSEEME